MDKNTTKPKRASRSLPGPEAAPPAPAGAGWVVGIDLGDTRSVASVYADGRQLIAFSFPMTLEGVTKAFEGRGYARVILEAGTQSAWVSRALTKLGYTPIVANTRKVKAIYANDRKSDRNDALLLARLGAADPALLYPIHHRTEEDDQAMALLKARDILVRARTRAIGHVRCEAKASGHRLSGCKPEAFTKRFEELPPALQTVYAPFLASVGSLNTSIRDYDAAIEKLAEGQDRVKPLLQVRGVGPITALAFALAIGDPKRFPDGRAVGAYFGMVPRLDQSGSSNKQCGISKAGNGFVRRLLVQCAQIICRSDVDSDLRRVGRKLAERGGPKAKKRAIIAVARRLAVLLFRLMDGRTYDPLFNAHRNGADSAVQPELPPTSRSKVTAGPPLPPSTCSEGAVQIAAPPDRTPSCTEPTAGSSPSADRSVDPGRTSTPRTRAATKRARGETSSPILGECEHANREATADGDRGGPPTATGGVSGAGGATASAASPTPRSRGGRGVKAPDATPPADAGVADRATPATTAKAAKGRSRASGLARSGQADAPADRSAQPPAPMVGPPERAIATSGAGSKRSTRAAEERIA